MSVTKYNYRGWFKDINLNTYKIELYHGNSYTWKTVDLLDVPITIEYEGSDDLLYKPLKYSGATVGVLTNGVDDYLFDIYSATADDCKVTLYDSSNNINWVGYVAPSLYSQGYESAREELSIDCNDGLSILKYFKYQSINSTPELHTMLDVILHCLQKCNCYSYLYFQKSVFIDKTSTDNILNKLNINEKPFFDGDAEYENGERITDDDDTYEDVLEKIMQYLGMTMIAEADNVYMIDYDAIKSNSGNISFFKINISNKTETSETITENSSIIGSDYAENGQQISLSKVFNKVTIVDKWNKVEDILPDLYDNEHITKIYPKPYYPTLLSGDNDALWFNCANIGEDGTNNGLYKFYKHDTVNFYAYTNGGTKTTMEQMMYDEQITSGVQRNNILTGTTGIGCCICYMKNYDADRYQAFPGLNDTWTKEPLPYFTYDKYVVFCLGKDRTHNTTALSNLYDSYYKPMVETELNIGTLIGSNNMYFVISGNFMYYDQANQFGIVEKYKRHNDDWDKSKFWIPCQLSYQGKYWDGSAWQNNQCRFKLYCNADDKDHYLGKDMAIINTVPWNWQINTEGTAIKLPDNIINDESPKFIIYTPASPDSEYRIDQFWMKNFNIKLVILNQDNEELNDSATAYTNVINTNNIEELDDIELDICTWDEKTIADNVVIAYNSANNTYYNLNTVYQPGMADILDTSTYNGLARFEELLCCKIANQYQQPNIELELSLNKDFKLSGFIHDSIINKDFIIDTKSIDVRYQIYKYNLIEKR